jgi:membrane protease YdiL (CAAX protease family)
MDLSRYEVRQDWRNFDEDVKKKSQGLWQQIFILVVLVTSVTFIISFIYQPSWLGWGAVRTIFIPALYIIASFYFATQAAKLHSQSKSKTLQFILGLRTSNLFYKITIGGMAGGILGLNFILLTIFLLPNEKLFDQYANIGVYVVVLLQLFMVAIGEELLLRGVGFSSLYERGEEAMWKTVLLIAIVNTIMYGVQLGRFIGTSFSVWLALFRFSYSVLATILRYQQDSTITSLACNLAFNSVLAVILPW